MIQYIQIETDDDGTIVGLGFVDSMTGAYSAVKKVLSETSGLPQYASTKDHIIEIERKARDEGPSYSIIKRELAKESGLEDCCTTEEHLAAIKSKARLKGIDNGRKYPTDILAKNSGLDPSEAVNKHIAVIQEAAWCRGANSKRDEILDILSDHSGLAPSNSIGDHIAAIKLKTHDQGYDEGWRDKQADIQKRMKQFEEEIVKHEREAD